jgi:hypothetical protein
MTGIRISLNSNKRKSNFGERGPINAVNFGSLADGRGDV